MADYAEYGIHLNADLHAEIVKAAESAGMSLGEWIRVSIIEKLARGQQE